MSVLKIFISKYEESIESARKIQKESDFAVDIIYIEEFYQNNEFENITKEDLIYFLCASPLIFEVIKIIQKKKCKIINKEYFLNNYSKKDVQILLKENNFRVPQIYLKPNCNDERFPLFCKENIHTGITIKVYNKSTLDKFFSKFDKKEFYLEEPIETDSNGSHEFKAYFINNHVHYKNNDYQKNKIIEEICNKIKEQIFINIEIFSIDFIYKNNNYFIIDFNPSSGLYASDSARREFIEYCDSLLIKNGGVVNV